MSQRPKSIYDGILSPSSENLDAVRSGLAGKLAFIDFQASPDITQAPTFSGDAFVGYGPAWYPPQNVRLNNFQTSLPDFTLPISGDWFFVDGVSSANIAVTLNDPASGGPDAPITLSPGMVCNFPFVGVTVHSVSGLSQGAYQRARLIYGNGVCPFERPFRPSSQDPLPVVMAYRTFGSSNAYLVAAGANGNGVGGASNQVLALNAVLNSRSRWEEIYFTVQPGIANAVIELVVGLGGVVPGTQVYPDPAMPTAPVQEEIMPGSARPAAQSILHSSMRKCEHAIGRCKWMPAF
jgi:hypothetical protein